VDYEVFSASAGPVMSVITREAAAIPAGPVEPFPALLEAAPDATVIVDGAGLIRLVNAQTEAMFGYHREELAGQQVDVLLPARLHGHHRLHRRHYAANAPVRPMIGNGLDLHGLRCDGAEFPIEISLSPLRAAGELFTVAAIRDVSERQAAEQRIRELAMIAESCSDAILMKTLDGTITYWNAAASSLYGYSPAEAVGQHVSMLAPPEKKTEIATLLARLRAGERIDHFETRRVTLRGDLLDVDVTLWPVHDRDGTVVGACALARDIAARKQAEQQVAQMYEQQRQVALTLQKALMGEVAPLPGVASASRYLPSTQGAGVGGDWYDLIPLGAGRTGVLVGDVMGRGLEAAAVMGRLRSAANALARTGMPPQQLMHALDLVARDIPEQLTTCCYMIIDPQAGEVTGCSAGHLPVLLAESDGTVHELPFPVSAPLGVGGIPHRQASAAVTARSTIAAYTDGLVERADRDIDEQIDALKAQLSSAIAAGESLEGAADQILAAFRPGSGEAFDDITLLLTRIPDRPLSIVTRTLDPEPRSARTARGSVREALAQWGYPELAETACLLVTEILTNAIRHARCPIKVTLCRAADELIVEVTDDSPQFPQRRLPDDDDEDGRGLVLVEALAVSWGARPAVPGKTVWFTLGLPAGRG
jgi:PAS domain S-box-containing protein